MSEFIGLKPFVCVNCISLSVYDMWLTIVKLQVVANISSSIWTTEIREHLIKFVDIMNNYPENLWKTSKKSYVLQLVRKERFFHIEDTNHPAIRELTSINWIFNATRNVLKSIYEIKSEIPHDITLLKELIALKESLESRRNIIQLCQQDLHSLHIYEELCGVYRSEILLLVEMIGGQSYFDNRNQSSSSSSNKNNHFSRIDRQQRSEEEFVFALSKLCNRQFEIDCKISNRNVNSIQYIEQVSKINSNSNSHSNLSPSSNLNNINSNSNLNTSFNLSPRKIHSEFQSPRRKKTSSNSLHMLLQNVFPTDDLQKKPIGKIGNI